MELNQRTYSRPRDPLHSTEHQKTIEFFVARNEIVSTGDPTLLSLVEARDSIIPPHLCETNELLTRGEIAHIVRAVHSRSQGNCIKGNFETYLDETVDKIEDRLNSWSFPIAEAFPSEMSWAYFQAALIDYYCTENGLQSIALARDGMAPFFTLSNFRGERSNHLGEIYLPGYTPYHPWESRYERFGTLAYDRYVRLLNAVQDKAENILDGLVASPRPGSNLFEQNKNLCAGFQDDFLDCPELHSFLPYIESQLSGLRNLCPSTHSEVCIYDTFGTGKSALIVASALQYLFPSSSFTPLLGFPKDKNLPSLDQYFDNTGGCASVEISWPFELATIEDFQPHFTATVLEPKTLLFLLLCANAAKVLERERQSNTFRDFDYSRIVLQADRVVPN